MKEREKREQGGTKRRRTATDDKWWGRRVGWWILPFAQRTPPGEAWAAGASNLLPERRVRAGGTVEAALEGLRLMKAKARMGREEA